MLSWDLSLITIHISDCHQFSDTHVSQGSVVIYLRSGEIFRYEFVANLPVSLPVKEFWQSLNICRSYGQEFSVLFFFDSGCRCLILYCSWDIASYFSKVTDFLLPHLHLATRLRLMPFRFRQEVWYQNISRLPMFSRFSRTQTCDRQTHALDQWPWLIPCDQSSHSKNPEVKHRPLLIHSTVICCCSKAVTGTRWQNLCPLLLKPAMLVVNELPRVKDLVRIVSKIPEFAMLGMLVLASLL